MARITSVVARYSGTVSFTDNTKEYFHCQMEDDRLWSVDADGSHSAQEEVTWATNDAGYIYYARQNLTLTNGLPFLSSAVVDTNYVVPAKTINGVVYHGEVLFALDDGTTWPSSMSYDPHYGYQWTNGGSILPTNLGTYVTNIENMLLQIFDVATLTIA